MDQSENYHQQLRDITPKISKTKLNVLQAEAKLKKVFWQQLCIAKDDGERSYNAQKAKAEASDSYQEMWFELAAAKAGLEALKIEEQAVNMAFEEWRTRMANLRAERSRYGA